METIRILLVDDHPLVRIALRRMLQQETDITEVDLLSPDVILMDIKMPGTDGIEGTRKVKEKCPSCNVLVFTFYEEYATQAIKAGAIGFLSKLIKHEELAMAIRAANP